MKNIDGRVSSVLPGVSMMGLSLDHACERLAGCSGVLLGV